MVAMVLNDVHQVVGQRIQAAIAIHATTGIGLRCRIPSANVVFQTIVVAFASVIGAVFVLEVGKYAGVLQDHIVGNQIIHVILRSGAQEHHHHLQLVPE